MQVNIKEMKFAAAELFGENAIKLSFEVVIDKPEGLTDADLTKIVGMANEEIYNMNPQELAEIVHYSNPTEFRKLMRRLEAAEALCEQVHSLRAAEIEAERKLSKVAAMKYQRDELYQKWNWFKYGGPIGDLAS